MTVYGKSSNTATPHTGKDAVLGAAKIIDALQVLSTREYDPLWPMSIMVGKITGGTARNIIADRVKLGGTIRFLFPEEKMHQKKVKEAFRRVVAGVCSTLDLQYELQFIPSNPSLINDGRMVALMKKAVEYTYGTTECMEETKSLIGEDFAEISQRVPAVMVFLGIYQPEAGSIYPQYHPKFTIDESVMRYGLELLLRATLRFLNEK